MRRSLLSALVLIDSYTVSTFSFILRADFNLFEDFKTILQPFYLVFPPDFNLFSFFLEKG